MIDFWLGVICGGGGILILMAIVAAFSKDDEPPKNVTKDDNFVPGLATGLALGQLLDPPNHY